jgi:hypothetical protein
MRYWQRLRRLEESRRQRLPSNHFLMIVRVPRHLPAGWDQAMWLRDKVECNCGVRGCPKLRIGLVAPHKAPSAEAWVERYAQRGRYA